MTVRARIRLRTQLLLLLPLLLAIPYVGYQYVREMESFLRQGLEDSGVPAPATGAPYISTTAGIPTRERNPRPARTLRTSRRAPAERYRPPKYSS